MSESLLNDIHNVLTVQLEQAFDYKHDAEELLKTTESERDIDLLKAEILSYYELIQKISTIDTNVEHHLYICYNKLFGID